MELAPGLHAVRQIQGIFVHAYLIEDGEKLILVDTLHSPSAKRVIRALKKIGRSVEEVTDIALTHAHRAHLGGLQTLKAASGARVHCHAWEADIVRGERKQQNMTLRPKPPYFLYPFQVGSRLASHPPADVDTTIGQGDRVGPLEVHHAPGHTPGHLVFYWPERRALLAGDALVTFPRFDTGWPGFMLNQVQQQKTLRKLAALEPEIIGAGHGSPVRAGGAAMLSALAARGA